MRRRKMSLAEATARHDLDLARGAFATAWTRLQFAFTRAAKQRKRIKYIERKLRMIVVADALANPEGNGQ